MADYNLIYTLQNRVLENIFSKETIFYLTGGTCLNRFYYNRRYSDDLDLFTNDNALFRDDVRIVIEGFKSSSIEYTASKFTKILNLFDTITDDISYRQNGLAVEKDSLDIHFLCGYYE